MENFNEIKSAELCSLLDRLGVKYELHRCGDEEFKFLEDGDISVKIPNPYAERTIFVDFQEEIFAFPDSREMAAELRRSWEQKGAEIHFLFWNPQYDKTVKIERKESV